MRFLWSKVTPAQGARKLVACAIAFGTHHLEHGIATKFGCKVSRNQRVIRIVISGRDQCRIADQFQSLLGRFGQNIT